MSEATGGRVDYYLATVAHPQREDQPRYRAECEDIIQALGMTFDEGCLFKALWRSAAARQGTAKPGHSALYDAQKMVHYAGRILRKLNQKKKGEEAFMAAVKGADQTVKSEDNGWIDWHGYDTPPAAFHPDQTVRIILRNGTRSWASVGNLRWKHTGDSSDIVKYKLG